MEYWIISFVHSWLQLFIIVYSKDLKQCFTREYYSRFFTPYEGKQIHKPNKYLPNKSFLQTRLEKLSR